MKGIGDLVAVVAQPIAKAIDSVAGTKISTCGGCQKRKEFLNRAVPFSKPETIFLDHDHNLQ